MFKPTILLASASPRRRELLQEHGYRIRIRPAQAEELMPDYLSVGETTLLNAKRKASEVARAETAAFVLGADTLVAIAGRILGKPRDMDEAVEMLSLLNGRTHEVFSGVWLMRASTGLGCGFIEMSRVHFHRLTRPQMRDYLARINPLDKAGAYAAQDDAPGIIRSIEGSYTNVVGLPMETLSRVLCSLKRAGVL